MATKPLFEWTKDDFAFGFDLIAIRLLIGWAMYLGMITLHNKTGGFVIENPLQEFWHQINLGYWSMPLATLIGQSIPIFFLGCGVHVLGRKFGARVGAWLNEPIERQ